MEGLEELKDQMDKGRDVGDACGRKDGSQDWKDSHECHVDSGVRAATYSCRIMSPVQPPWDCDWRATSADSLATVTTSVVAAPGCERNTYTAW